MATDARGWFRIPTQAVLLGPAPIDWCEGNHASSNPFSVEEFHNTWTNVAYVIAGALLYKHSHTRPRSTSTDPVFAFFCAFVILTGVTSGWFHATLIFAAQKTDEFFENAAVLALMYYNISLPSNDDMNTGTTNGSNRRWCLALVTHTMVMGIGVFAIPEVFCEAHLICSVLVCFQYGLARVDTIKCERTRTSISNLFHRSFVSAGIGFSFWIVDFAFCSELVRSLHLHAYAWHFLTALALYYGGLASFESNMALVKQNKIK